MPARVELERDILFRPRAAAPLEGRSRLLARTAGQVAALPLIPSVLAIGAALLVWQAATDRAVLPAYVLPPPGKVLAAWLQLLPGEVLSCNGCHLPASQQKTAAGMSSYSHGRQGLFASAWSGSTGTAPFPGTLGQYTTCPGETISDGPLAAMRACSP